MFGLTAQPTLRIEVVLAESRFSMLGRRHSASSLRAANRKPGPNMLTILGTQLTTAASALKSKQELALENLAS